MEIRIRYQLRQERPSRVIEMSPEDYFDPLDTGETFSVRSVPRLAETWQYTPHQSDELLWTVLEITNSGDFWRVRTQYLDGLRSLMYHSQEANGSEEIIHQIELSPQCWHTIRTLKEEGKTWTVVMNCVSSDRPGGVESRDFCGLWSFEELKAFGAVQ